MIERFGKESAGYRQIRGNFLELAYNDAGVRERRRLDDIYASQSRRRFCKTCDDSLQGSAFSVKGIDYVACRRCGHLNGAFEDTRVYTREIYLEADQGAQDYTDVDRNAFTERVQSIYQPKVEFLIEGLERCGEIPRRLRYADVGAGSGHFVAALISCGLDRVVGYEVSPTQVKTANGQLGHDIVRCISLDAVADLARTLEAEVATSIFSLEHLEEPRAFLSALAANERVRYLYLAVPLFSPATVLECAFPDLMPRQLGMGHTHLYTESSLNWLFREFGYRPLAAWWFGADVFDLHRSVVVGLRRAGGMEDLVRIWSEMIVPAMDEVQLAFDRRKLSSEVHYVLAVDGPGGVRT